MKKLIISLILAVACMVFPIATFSASAAILNTPTEQKTVDGVTYKKYEYTDNGKQTMFYGEYKPGEDSEYEFIIYNRYSSSSGTVQLTTVAKLAQEFTEKTGRKVVMATNGDYFYNTGASVESLVKEGVVYNKGNFTYKHCFGFDNNGKTAIGRMTEVENYLEITTDDGLVYYHIDGLNKTPDDGQLVIYTSANNVSLNGCCKYKVKTDSTNMLQFPTEGTASRMSTGTVVDDKALSLKTGEFAIVVKGDNEISKFLYDTISYGTAIRLVEKPAGSFINMTYVVGGYDVLVDNGQINTTFHTDNGGDSYAPRTTIGVKADGTMFLVVLDGRQSGYSVGCTVKRQAQIALELGAVQALELDGGGSSTFLFDFNDGKGLTLLNKPSDGNERKVSNAVLLVEKQKQTPPEENESTEEESQVESNITESNPENNSGNNGQSSANGGSGCSSAVNGATWFLPLVATYAIIKKRKI